MTYNLQTRFELFKIIDQLLMLGESFSVEPHKEDAGVSLSLLNPDAKTIPFVESLLLTSPNSDVY